MDFEKQEQDNENNYGKREHRLWQLQALLEYCSNRITPVFSIGERICINQERGRLMDEEFDFHKPFEHSSKLKSKITFTLEKLNFKSYTE